MLYQETFQSGENSSEINVSCCIYINGVKYKNAGFPNHCHSFFEFEYIMQGSGESQIDGKRIKVDDRCLLIKPPLCVHGAVGNDRSANMVIQFGYNFLSRNATTFPKNSLLVPTCKILDNGVIHVEEKSQLEQYLLDIAAIAPSFLTPVENEERNIRYSPEYEWKLNALTLRLIAYLMEEGYLIIDNTAGNFSDVPRIQMVLNHLISRPEEKISMEDAARMACMSYSYFSLTFKKIIGRSFVDYCNDIKIHRAEELLNLSKMSITEISSRLGFGSVSYFNRIFKSYNGRTPMQYRNNSIET